MATRPISMIMPIIENRLNVLPVSSSAAEGARQRHGQREHDRQRVEPGLVQRDQQHVDQQDRDRERREQRRRAPGRAGRPGRRSRSCSPPATGCAPAPRGCRAPRRRPSARPGWPDTTPGAGGRCARSIVGAVHQRAGRRPDPSRTSSRSPPRGAALVAPFPRCRAGSACCASVGQVVAHVVGRRSP